jgi:hypothetical protein
MPPERTNQEKSIHELREESRRWSEENGHKGFYSHECPNASEQHNRECEIRRRIERDRDPDGDS